MSSHPLAFTLRVLLDTNVLISYLLGPDRRSAVVTTVEAALGGEYTLLLPGPLLDELVVRIESKPYLAQRILQLKG